MATPPEPGEQSPTTITAALALALVRGNESVRPMLDAATLRDLHAFARREVARQLRSAATNMTARAGGDPGLLALATDSAHALTAAAELVASFEEG